jgi:hypothetical protein
MRSVSKLACVSAVVVFCFGTCFAQSLADAARQQQALKKSNDTTPHRVITNDDLSSTSKGDDSAVKAKVKKHTTSGSTDASSDQDDDRPTAEEITRNVKMQRQTIAELQDRVSELQKEMEPWKTSDCTHVMHIGTSINACDVPQRLTAELDQTKSQLEQEKKNLAAMQEDARKMGFANSVYDPN